MVTCEQAHITVMTVITGCSWQKMIRYRTFILFFFLAEQQELFKFFFNRK